MAISFDEVVKNIKKVQEENERIFREKKYKNYRSDSYINFDDFYGDSNFDYIFGRPRRTEFEQCTAQAKEDLIEFTKSKLSIFPQAVKEAQYIFIKDDPKMISKEYRSNLSDTRKAYIVKHLAKEYRKASELILKAQFNGI